MRILKPEDEKALRYTFSMKPSVKKQIVDAARDIGITESAFIAIAARDYIKRMA